MWVIVTKEVLSNRISYPDSPTLFTRTFRNPDNAAEFVTFYSGDQTAAGLGVPEYTGELPRDPNAIRIISKAAFQARLSATGSNVRAEIRNSTLDAVADLREDLAAAAYVNLDDVRTSTGIYSLGPSPGLGWLTSPQVADVLADGTEAEAYRGVL